MPEQEKKKKCNSTLYFKGFDKHVNFARACRDRCKNVMLLLANNDSCLS